MRPSALGKIIRREMQRRDWSYPRTEMEIRKRVKGVKGARTIAASTIHLHCSPLADGEYRTVERETLTAYALTFGVPLHELKRAELEDSGWQIFAGEPGESFAALADTELTEEQREELRVRMREVWREVLGDTES